MKKQEELKVLISSSNSVCDECGETLGLGAWTMAAEKGAFCLSCADMDHLVFLPAGEAALTRKSRKYSALSAVVLQWATARKRYERQGVLVEAQALERAEMDCLADKEARQRQQEREAIRRARLNQDFVDGFARRVRALYPGCPAGREAAIAEHACLKHRGPVGCPARDGCLDEGAVRSAVIVHIRHAETPYDELLMMGHGRWDARDMVAEVVDGVLAQWQTPKR